MILILAFNVTALTQTQLESYSDNDIKTYLIDNAIEQNVYYDKPSNNYVFSYVLKTISKVDNEYHIIDKPIYGYVGRNMWTLCRSYYNYNQCYNYLVNNVDNSFSVKFQLKLELNNEIRQIIKWRDNPTITETIGGVLLE